MQFFDKPTAIAKMNHFGKHRTPFLFMTSFDTQNNIVVPLDEVDPLRIAYDFKPQGLSNTNAFQTLSSPVDLSITPTCQPTPVTFEVYEKAFKPLHSALKDGTINLANLTFPTPIQCNLSLTEIYLRTQAKYRVFLKDHFCCFSPETFVRIHNNVISTFPMKGTINADLPDAEQQLLNNPKEIDEHDTVIKQALEDISLVAGNSRVVRARYVDDVKTHHGRILQTSSEIAGDLPSGFQDHLGDTLFTLLPAGSITGAPRAASIEILRNIETYQRGFYSGVAGIFDGENLDSAVLIRYLEATERPQQYVFKSGGGITKMSDATSEYHELIEKIYLPFI